jgi:hypothetical protein
MIGINPYNIKIPYDKVLLKMKPVNDKIVFSNGGELLIDTTFNSADHANVIAEVIQIPQKFSTPTESTAQKGIEWKPTCDVKPGDKVIIDYHECMINFGTKVNRFIGHPVEMFLEWEGEYFVFINYHSMYAKIDGDDLVPLNGYVIFEGVSNKMTFGEYTKETFDPGQGVIKYVGNCNVEYIKTRNFKGQGWLFDVDGMAPGEKCYFRKRAGGMHRKLEYDSHATHNKNLYVIQRRYILAQEEYVV